MLIFLFFCILRTRCSG